MENNDQELNLEQTTEEAALDNVETTEEAELEQGTEQEQVESEGQQEAEEKPLTQEEFNQLYFKQKQAEREKLALEQELAKLKAEKEQPKQPEKPKTLEDFDFDDDAFHEWKVQDQVNKALAAREADQAKQQQLNQQQEALKAIQTSFVEKEVEYHKANPDYQKAIDENSALVQFSKELGQVVLEEGPELDHYLLRNPQVADKLNGLSGYKLGVEIAKITSSMSKPKPVQQSKAPTPPPVASGGGRASKPAGDSDDMSSYYQKEMERLKGKK